MRLLSVVTIIVVLGLALMVLTGIDLLRNLDGDTPELLGQLMVGHTHSLFASSMFWRTFPSLPRSPWLFDTQALVIMLPMLLAAVYGVRYRMNRSFLLAGWACLPLCALPYAMGMITLARNTELQRCGPWIATMLLSMLLSLLACGACAVLHLWRPRRQAAAVEPAPASL